MNAAGEAYSIAAVGLVALMGARLVSGIPLTPAQRDELRVSLSALCEDAPPLWAEVKKALNEARR